MAGYLWSKSTGTHADVLVAAGLAQVLASIGRGGQPREVALKDEGSRYRIDVTPDLESDAIDCWDGDPFYPYIRGVLKGDSGVPAGAIDYAGESKKLDAARKRTGGRAKRKRPTVATVEDTTLSAVTEEPHAEIALLRMLNGMRKGFFGDLHMHKALRANPPREALRARLAALRKGATRSADEPAGPQIKLTASQWFTPLTGKGICRVKANGVALVQFPSARLDWFESWMRFVGMYHCLTGHVVSDDIVLCAIAPGAAGGIPFHTLGTSVRGNLRDRRVGGGNLEVRVILETTRALVRHSAEYAEGPNPFRFGRRRPSDVISGLHVTTYKKMGTASAVMNVAFLGLPGWMAIETRADAVACDDVIEDIDIFQRQLVNDKGKVIDADTLRALREMLATGTLEATLTFLARMAVAVTARLTAGAYAQFLSTATVRRILMAQDELVKRIIDDAGFQAVATAMRRATIHAMLDEDSALEPFYGLAQTWKQHASDKPVLASLLGEFVQRFNTAVARKVEDSRKKGGERPRIKLVTEDELASVLQLMEEPGSSSSLVAHLLLGFGYAQTKRDDSSPLAGKGE
ncbi:MAG: hypothetical protein KIT14_11280 [bacterium]|nr:hypothetical protein [bacterium]